MKSTRDILLDRGYPKHAADITTAKLDVLSGIYAQARDKWLRDSIETDIESNGYTIFGLMTRFPGMAYPAALLTIDWLRREPEKATLAIERGIR